MRPLPPCHCVEFKEQNLDSSRRLARFGTVQGIGFLGVSRMDYIDPEAMHSVRCFLAS